MIVKMHKHTKDYLKEYDDGTYNEIISRLSDKVENYMPIVDLQKSTVNSTIRIDEELFEKLSSFRLTDGESVENIIMRMLVVAQTLNNMEE